MTNSFRKILISLLLPLTIRKMKESTTAGYLTAKRKSLRDITDRLVLPPIYSRKQIHSNVFISGKDAFIFQVIKFIKMGENCIRCSDIILYCLWVSKIRMHFIYLFLIKILRREIGLQTPDCCNDEITHEKAILFLKLSK